MEIIKLTHNDVGDFSDLLTIFETVFEWDNFTLPTQAHLQKVLFNPAFLVFVARMNNTIVGGLTVHVLESYESEKPSAYLYDLAVSTDQQRKGVGKLLIAALIDYCQKNGFKEIFVQAETEDIHAVNFYQQTPISSALNATHFTYSFDGPNENSE